MESRLESQRETILSKLRSAGGKGLTNEALSKIALRYGGAIGQLYQLGYVIDKVNLGQGLYKYILISEPKEEISTHVKAQDLLLDAVNSKSLITSQELGRLIEDLGLSVRYKAGTHKESAKLLSRMA